MKRKRISVLRLDGPSGPRWRARDAGRPTAPTNTGNHGETGRPQAEGTVEAEGHHVSFLDDVVLAFEPQPTRIACPGLAAVLDEIIVRDRLCADEAALEIGVDHARGLRRGRAALDGPRADFLFARREVSLQSEQLVTGPDHAIEARLIEAHVSEERAAIGGVELRELLFDGRAHRHDLRAFARGTFAHF